MKSKKTVHLVCNAHLDPVWLWQWEEGAAETLSTFRTAAGFCESFDGFVFNHNEAVLYEWVEEYDPALFRRIRNLVRAGKWHIAGGWYIQPDCNMPSGESFVRQILAGKRYFLEKFGVDNTTAYNFDPFGHTRGLVQILSKSGYDSYIHCRPAEDQMLPPLPAHTYRWIGYDGSSVLSHLAYRHYLSLHGKAAEKVQAVLKDTQDEGLPAVLILWGVGNHGGGPSRKDLEDLERLRRQRTDVRIVHSTPEAFFGELRRRHRGSFPEVRHELQRCHPGCYTSQVRLKQAHRMLENLYYAAERMAAHAWANRLAAYPKKELDAALRDLLFGEFHDILPGSGIKPVEEHALRTLGRGAAASREIRARAFFALADAGPPAREGEVPVFVANPHPWPVCDVFECEFNVPPPKWGGEYPEATVRKDGRCVPAQVEQVENGHNIFLRKRVAFRATVPPFGLSRFDVTLDSRRRARTPSALKQRRGLIHFQNDTFALRISTRTGLVESLTAGGKHVLGSGAFRILCLDDDNDPWGTYQHRVRHRRGAFRLASRSRANALRGLPEGKAGPVTVIEDGPVRSVVEAVLVYHDSHAAVRYILPRRGRFFDVHLVIHNAEKAAMLKLCLPLAVRAAHAYCQTAYGREERDLDGSEQVGQRWVALTPGSREAMGLGVLNGGTYAFDATARELRLNLLRSPLYSFLPLSRDQKPMDTRFLPRIDQGERHFRFRVIPDRAPRLLDRIDREAQVYNESPFVLSYYPSGKPARDVKSLAEIANASILLTAAKKAEVGNELVLRLFNPLGRSTRTRLTVLGKWKKNLSFVPFEVKTLRINPRNGRTKEADLLER